MRTFFYMGRNAATRSGVSWKIWRIERRGRTVTTWWGPATLVKRRVVPTHGLRSKKKQFASGDAAARHEQARIQNKRGKGYESRPRAR